MKTAPRVAKPALLNYTGHRMVSLRTGQPAGWTAIGHLDEKSCFNVGYHSPHHREAQLAEGTMKHGNPFVFFNLFLIVACSSEEPTSAGDLKDLGARSLSNSVATELPETVDDKFARAALNEVPGFAGYYFDGESLVLKLVDRNQSGKAKAWVSQLRGGRMPHVLNVRIETADFDFAQLKIWHNKILSRVGTEGVFWLDIDERLNRLHVGVANQATATEFLTFARDMGIPSAALQIDTAPPPEFRGSLQDRAPTVRGGYEIENEGQLYCTLGFNALYLGQSVFVTASHCSLNRYVTDNGAIYQPGPLLSQLRIGAELRDRALSSCDGIWWHWCRWSDASYMRFDAGVAFSFGTIARPLEQQVTGRAGSIQVDENSPLEIIRKLPDGDVAVGTVMDKVGMVSGWTSGVVTQTCVAIADFRCQYITTTWSQPGDSGSPIFSLLVGQYAELHGILWGGPQGDFNRTYYSPLTGVVRDLGQITVCNYGGC